MENRKSLTELVGTRIAVLAPRVFNETIMEEVMLRGVEAGGIWIESQKLTEGILNTVGRTMAPRILVFFLPWHQLYWVMSSIDVPAISGKATEL